MHYYNCQSVPALIMIMQVFSSGHVIMQHLCDHGIRDQCNQRVDAAPMKLYDDASASMIVVVVRLVVQVGVFFFR